MAEAEYFRAPDCDSSSGKHTIQVLTDETVWYAKCTMCGERFVLISETVINNLGIQLEPRPTKRKVH